MNRTRLTLMAVCLVTVACSGCHLVEHPKSAMRRMTRMFTPTPDDWDSEVNEDVKEWDFVGEEGRGDQTRERDPDQWFKKHLMSEKANSIERNLGID